MNILINAFAAKVLDEETGARKTYFFTETSD